MYPRGVGCSEMAGYPVHSHSTTNHNMSPLNAETLSALHHIEAGSPLAALLTTTAIQNFAKTQLPQTAHRIEVVKAWEVELDGRNVLEIGCGQGDASVVLASAVGQGRVTAWDPADPEYGASSSVIWS